MDAKLKHGDVNSAYSSERLWAGMGSDLVAVGRPLWHYGMWQQGQNWGGETSTEVSLVEHGGRVVSQDQGWGDGERRMH